MIAVYYPNQEPYINHMVRFDNSDDAIIGFTVLPNGERVVVYNYYDLLSIHSADFPHVDNRRAEAAKWVNILQEQHDGPISPIILYPCDAEMLDMMEQTEIRH